ncbi:hypothetical protein [Dehalobacterium formicoaceticum]|nr:hypothetical protein [Dehalobacterium formicoaceticum]
MAKSYTKEERIEALKLANEIGAAAAAQRFKLIFYPCAFLLNQY